ncbi:LON peptidase substrate-binding domain-containing protein [Antrihabitans sp. YC2-6]|nr:LON peptidase substrate-binding domain-containing protein [Antrihabitans sp. YC2-6]
MQTLPMFPLGTVLLPRERLPLQIFEPRYVEMLDACTGDGGDGRFGVVLITRGREVGGGEQRTDVGTVARIVATAPFSRNRYAVVAVGEERIRVTGWLPDDPYPRAEVEEWPDTSAPRGEEVDAFDVVTAKTAELDELWRLLAAKSGAVVPKFSDGDLPEDPSQRSFAVASGLPLSEADRYKILAAPGPADRLRAVAEALDDVIAGLRFRTM